MAKSKYEELKELLQTEVKRMVVEFNTNAKVGDFARMGQVVGIITQANTFSGMMSFTPLNLGTSAVSHVVLLNEENIPQIELFGDDFTVIAKTLQEKVRADAEKYKDIPF